MGMISGDEKAVKLGAIGELKGFIKEMLASHMGGKKPKEMSVEIEAEAPKPEMEDDKEEELSPELLQKLMNACK
jgi:hypothetical protein